MAGFEFDLQRVLEMRQRVEDQKKSKLAEVQGRINRQLTRIEKMQHSRRQLLSDKKRTGEVLSLTETALRAEMFRSIDRSIDGSHSRISAMQGELAAARREYIAARQQRMAIEKLKEKHRREWERQQRLMEARQLDEIAAQRFIRKMHNGSN